MDEATARKAVEMARALVRPLLLEMDYGQVAVSFIVHQGRIRLELTHRVSQEVDPPKANGPAAS